MSETQLIKASDINDGVDKLFAGVDGFVNAAQSFLKAKSNTGQFSKLVATQSQRTVLAKTVAAFSAVDAKFEGGMVKIGTLCRAILKLDETGQRLAINEIAKANGLEETKETGRKGLVYALFGRFPEMQRASGKDTLAGKRLSSYIAAATAPKKKTGKGRGRQPMPAGATKVNSAHGYFDALFEVANEKEGELLIELSQRAKIDVEDWLDEYDRSDWPTSYRVEYEKQEKAAAAAADKK